jgi:mutator protein MutT
MSFEITSTFLNDSCQLTPQDAVAAIVMTNEGQVLLQLRDDKNGIFFPNHWGFFGGAIEKNETPDCALMRELEEELCVEFTNAQVEKMFTIELGFSQNSDLIKRIFYAVKIANEQIKKIQLCEGKEARFFSQEESLSIPNFVPYDRFGLWAFFNRGRVNVI